MTQNSLWLHRFAVLTAVSTFILIFVGGLVTSTASGLSVPDWPLSFGKFFPPMKGGVVYEHGHRMVAAFVGFLTIILALWIYRSYPQNRMRWVGFAALTAVILQGILGGMTVLLSLPTEVSVAHACLAQAFFGLTVSIAVFTSPKWRRPLNFPASAHLSAASVFSYPLLRLSAITTAFIYIQLILGAIMRHMGAGLAIRDFPLAFGRLIPPLHSEDVLIHFLHRLGAVAVVFFVIWTISYILIRYHDDPPLIKLGTILSVLLIFQVFLGVFTIWTQRSVIPTTAHVAMGAALLATSLMLTLHSYILYH